MTLDDVRELAANAVNGDEFALHTLCNLVDQSPEFVIALIDEVNVLRKHIPDHYGPHMLSDLTQEIKAVRSTLNAALEGKVQP